MYQAYSPWEDIMGKIGSYNNSIQSQYLNPSLFSDMLSKKMKGMPDKDDSGLLTAGNIDLKNRPVVKNPETGGYSTVWSMGIGLDNGKEALIPRVSDEGTILSEKEAIKRFKETGRHLGIYGSRDAANKAAEQLHKQQESTYKTKDKQ